MQGVIQSTKRYAPTVQWWNVQPCIKTENVFFIKKKDEQTGAGTEKIGWKMFQVQGQLMTMGDSRNSSLK